MNKPNSGVFFLDLSNEKYCEEIISSLLNIDNVYVDCDGDECGYIFIDDIVKIAYENGEWEVSYFLEYGPLDKYAIFELEQHALFTYQALKKCFNYNPTINHFSDYPKSEVTIGYPKTELTKEFVKKFYEHSKVISSFYYGNPSLFQDNLYYEIIKKEYKEYLFNLTFAEYINLKTELQYIGWLLLLLVSGYESISGEYDLYQIYTNGEIKVGLTDVFLHNDISYKAIHEDNFHAELQLELDEYLIVISKEKKYVVEKEGYSFLKSLINEFNDAYEDGRGINFYINDDYDLIMCNSVFTVVQKVYVGGPIARNIITSDIANLERNLHQIKGAEYFDESEIIKRFETLINAESTSEYEIESYIKEHYRILLGKQYTKVVTQALTNFKINEKDEERRFDIFVYNRSNSDWELYELKKSNVRVIKKVRDIYSFQAKVQDGVAQLRYYKGILAKEDVKNTLKKNYDIEYNVPKFKLIIGSGNDINIRICEEQINDIEIKTYTQLVEMAKSYYG